MKLILGFFLIVFLLKATASDLIFTHRAGEIKLSNSILSKLVYDFMKVPEVEANLVSGQFHKFNQYLFCLKDLELEKPYQCSVYLKPESPRRLANIERDLDFGQTDIIDAIYDKEVESPGEIEMSEGMIKFVIKGKVALKIINLIGENLHTEGGLKRNNQVQCQKKANVCTITIPLQIESDEEDELSF